LRRGVMAGEQQAGPGPELVHVGVLGAGRMGRPIIGHLARAGFPVAVYDPDEGKRLEAEMRGARLPGRSAKSPASARSSWCAWATRSR
jgi:3-hydroxyacyl-CoA dehydrogenase